MQGRPAHCAGLNVIRLSRFESINKSYDESSPCGGIERASEGAVSLRVAERASAINCRHKRNGSSLTLFVLVTKQQGGINAFHSQALLFWQTGDRITDLFSLRPQQESNAWGGRNFLMLKRFVVFIA
jgi:hypothetical protein